MINFNIPNIAGKELEYIEDAVNRKQISGDGYYSNLCHLFFENTYQFKKCLLTSSCTDALEMAAILIDIKEGDEIIVPDFTFVSTANAFVLRGAKIIFADSNAFNPNIDEQKLEALITNKTKAIVTINYAGIPCNYDYILALCKQYHLYLIEDNAQGFDSYYNSKPLGSFGDFATFSFHETKNIYCGEGGMLVINNSNFIERAEIIREKGTNRTQFYKKKVSKYEWLDIGSSFLMSDLSAAFLYGQIENFENIQHKRVLIFNTYFKLLIKLEEQNLIKLPINPFSKEYNASIFYFLTRNEKERNDLIKYLNNHHIMAVFHYLPLHLSPFGTKFNTSPKPNSIRYSKTIIRLPIYNSLSIIEVEYICNTIQEFYYNFNKI